jgi:hypothetical protein
MGTLLLQKKIRRTATIVVSSTPADSSLVRVSVFGELGGRAVFSAGSVGLGIGWTGQDHQDRERPGRYRL